MIIDKRKNGKHKNDEYDFRLQRIFDGLLLFMWLWIPLLLIFAGLTALEVGHIPSYGNPDPKDTTYSGFFVPLIRIGHISSCGAIAMWLGIMIYGLKGKAELRYLWSRIIIFVTCVIITINMLRAGGLLDWFMD